MYFECRINKNALLQTVFGDFAHWVLPGNKNNQTQVNSKRITKNTTTSNRLDAKNKPTQQKKVFKI